VEELLVTAVGYLKLAIEAVGAAIVGFGALATVAIYLLSLFGIRKRSYSEIRCSWAAT
jgi:integral membrane sensor domain MASE1